jgi:hypothetical protein
MDKASAQPQVNLSLLRSIFLKFQPLSVFEGGGGAVVNVDISAKTTLMCRLL